MQKRKLKNFHLWYFFKNSYLEMKQIVQLLRFTIFKKFTFQILLFKKKKLKKKQKKKNVKQFCLFSSNSLYCRFYWIYRDFVVNKLGEQIEPNWECHCFDSVLSISPSTSLYHLTDFSLSISINKQNWTLLLISL